MQHSVCKEDKYHNVSTKQNDNIEVSVKRTVLHNISINKEYHIIVIRRQNLSLRFSHQLQKSNSAFSDQYDLCRVGNHVIMAAM
jgi:hypothetical protein